MLLDDIPMPMLLVFLFTALTYAAIRGRHNRKLAITSLISAFVFFAIAIFQTKEAALSAWQLYVPLFTSFFVFFIGGSLWLFFDIRHNLQKSS